MKRFMSAIVWLGVMNGAYSFHGATDETGKTYYDARSLAVKEGKHLILIVSQGKHELPRDAVLDRLLSNNVVVHLAPDFALDRQNTVAGFFELSASDVEKGVLIVGDFRNRQSESFGKITATIKGLSERKAAEIADHLPGWQRPSSGPLLRARDAAWFTNGKGGYAKADAVEKVAKGGVLVDKKGNEVFYHEGDFLIDSKEFGKFAVASRGEIPLPHDPANGVIAEHFVQMIRFATANLGCQVNGGGCNSLCGMGGTEIGRVSPGGQVTGKIVPGAVLKMLNYTIRADNGVTFGPSAEHYSVVESYNAKTGWLCILQQNVSGSPVRRDWHYLPSLTGTFLVRAPNPSDCPAINR